MDARLRCAGVLLAALVSLGAGYRTHNFVVEAPTPQLAKEIGDAAEQFRKDLALLWLGEEMPRWGQPCMLTAQVSPRLGAGGATSFVFDRGEVFGWRMNIQGSRERILDSVLPHEVTHTVFACHFRRPLPRWADEGACTTVEHPSEKKKQERMLVQFLQTGRGISFSKMFKMKDYPRDVMPLYSQGYSLARYLIGRGGRQKFLDFVADGLEDEDWTRAIEKFYGFDSMLALQNTWIDWVKRGSPEAPATADVVAASAQEALPNADLIYRAQSEDAAQAPAPASDGAATGLVAVPPAKARPVTVAGSDNVASNDWRPAGTTRIRIATGTDRAAEAMTEKSYAQQAEEHLSSGSAQSTARPQPPQSPGQIVLEPDRQAGQSGGGRVPSAPPVLDASRGGRILR